MAKLRGLHAIPNRPQSELQHFASWFGQDSKLMFGDFREGARIYFSMLTSERRQVLRRELAEFNETHCESSGNAIKRMWLKKLGAEAWQKDLDIRETLVEFFDILVKLQK